MYIYTHTYVYIRITCVHYDTKNLGTESPTQPKHRSSQTLGYGQMGSTLMGPLQK